MEETGALDRTQKLVRLANPDTYEFPVMNSEEFAPLLYEAVSGTNVNMVFGETSFPPVYQSVIQQLLDLHPVILSFDSLLTSDELVQIGQKVMWLVTYGCTAKRLLHSDTPLMRDKIYDELARSVTLLIRKVAGMARSFVNRFVELWSIGICAAIFTMFLMEHQYENAFVFRAYPFIIRFEREIRDMLVGFQSPCVLNYHQSIFELVPSHLRIVKGCRRMETVQEGDQDSYGYSDFSKNISEMLAREPDASKAWKQRKRTMPLASTQTVLIRHAMKMVGEKLPKIGIPQKPAPRKEKSIMKVSKATEIVEQTNIVLEDYKEERKQAIDELCDNELHYEYMGVAPEAVPLGITFETFGEKEAERPLYRVRPPGVDQSPPRQRVLRYSTRAIAAAQRINGEPGRCGRPKIVIKPVMAKSGRQEKRVYRRFKPFNEREMMETVREAHAYLLENP